MPQRERTPGVYVDLDELVAMRPHTRGFSFLPKQPVHSLLSGSHASKLRGRGLNFDESRQYLPGDDIRHIDWKVTARTGKPYSRIFTEERERPTLLIIDQRLNMFFGSRRIMKSVAAAHFAALAAWRVLAGKDRIGGILFNDSQVKLLKPSGSPNQTLRLLQAVCEQNQMLTHHADIESSPQQFNLALEQALQLAHHDHLICIVSDGYGSNERTRELITSFGQHNDVMIAFVSDPMEHDLPAAGHLVFAQQDKQLEVNTHDSRIRQTFPEDRQTRLKQAREFLTTREAAVLTLSTASPVLDQVIDQIGQASARRRA